MYQLVRGWTLISSNTNCLGRRKMSYELIYRMLSNSKVMSHRKVSVMEPLPVVVEVTIE